MNITECPNCDKSLKETASFCGKCRTQVRCLNCKEPISSDDECCEACGKDIEKRTSSNGAINKIRFDGTSFEAEFTNEVGKEVTTTFGQIFLANRDVVFKNRQVENVSDSTGHSTIDIQPEYIQESPIQNKKESNSISSVFRESEDKLDLIETRIKASGKGDYSARLTYLIVLYFDNKGEKTRKSIINKTIEFCGLYDSNYRNWFGGMKSHFLVDSGNVELRPAGKEVAAKFLNDVFDENIVGQWDLGDLKSGSKTQKKDASDTKKKATKASSNSQTPTLINSLNFHPKDAESLKDFYKKFDAKSNFEKNLIFVHYLQNVIKSNEVGLNHIFSCYKHLGERIPGNLYQSLLDTKTKGWIDTKNMNKITIPVAGQNYFEHDLKRK